MNQRYRWTSFHPLAAAISRTVARPSTRNAYTRMNMDAPWKHFGDRCFRTMKNLGGARNLAPPHEGHIHNALVDARQQAKWLCNIINTLHVTV